MLKIPLNSILSIRYMNSREYRIVLYKDKATYAFNPKYIRKNGEKHAFRSKREAIGIVKKLYKVVLYCGHNTYGEDCIDYIVLGNKKCTSSAICTEDSKIISKLSIY